MKIAYLILAHNTPNHLRHLIESLSTNASTFFIHIDKKSDIKEYAYLKKENVHFTKKRIAVYWGDFSLVEAILNLLRTAFLSTVKFDRFVLLSGADYPIKSTAYIENFFRKNSDKEFISIDKQAKLVKRLTKYKLSPKDGKIINSIKKVLQKLNLIPQNRNYKNYLKEITPYGGSGWWAISYDAVDYILRFVNKNPKIVKFFKHTICPDEIFFSTILGNSHFKEKSVRELTFADWGKGGKSPAYITHEHIERLKHPSVYLSSKHNPYGYIEFLFARKFPDNSTHLVRALNEQIKGFDD